MPTDFDLDSRKPKILRVVVQSYILSGRPVGSRTVAEACALSISPATVRGEMAKLENMGFLVQPHTSAGRVPTDLAYRYYVDMLMGQPTPSSRDIDAVELLFTARSREMEGLLHEASLLLSKLTRTTAMVFAPYTAADTVRHLELVRLSGKRVMAVLITESGQVGRMLIDLKEPVSADTVERVAIYLNRTIEGKEMEQLDPSSLQREARFGSGGMELMKAVVEDTREFMSTIEERVFIGGTANIVREMERAGSEWVQTLLEALDKQYFILDLLKDIVREKHLTVRIGEENRFTELRKFAFVGTSYPLGAGLSGSLGVVGPTCMDYARTIGMVEYMAQNLGRKLKNPGQ